MLTTSVQRRLMTACVPMGCPLPPRVALLSMTFPATTMLGQQNKVATLRMMRAIATCSLLLNASERITRQLITALPATSPTTMTETTLTRLRSPLSLLDVHAADGATLPDLARKHATQQLAATSNNLHDCVNTMMTMSHAVDLGPALPPILSGVPRQDDAASASNASGDRRD